MTSDKPIVVLISKNIVFLPRIEAAAGSSLRVRRLTETDMADPLVRENELVAIIVDLEEDKSIWKPVLKELNHCLLESSISVQLVAYGPHEDKDSMDEARAMGCDPVLSKGAFVNQIRSILHP